MEKESYEELITFINAFNYNLSKARGVESIAQGSRDYEYIRGRGIPVSVVYKSFEDPMQLGQSEVLWVLKGEPGQSAATTDDSYHGVERTFTVADLGRDKELRDLVTRYKDQVQPLSATIYLSDKLLDPDGLGNPVTRQYNVAETGVHEFRHLATQLGQGVAVDLEHIAENLAEVDYCVQTFEADALSSDKEVEEVARHQLQGGDDRMVSRYDVYMEQQLLSAEICPRKKVE